MLLKTVRPNVAVLLKYVLLLNDADEFWVNVELLVIPLNVAAPVWVNVVLLVIPLNGAAPVWLNVELLLIPCVVKLP